MFQSIVALRALFMVTALGMSLSLFSAQANEAPSVMPQASAADIKAGKALYLANCAVCHGKTGKADGPVGKSLRPKPRNFTTGEFKYSKNDAELLAFIQKGKAPMPAWEKSLKPEEIKNIIAFIHTLDTSSEAGPKAPPKEKE